MAYKQLGNQQAIYLPALARKNAIVFEKNLLHDFKNEKENLMSGSKCDFCCYLNSHQTMWFSSDMTDVFRCLFSTFRGELNKLIFALIMYLFKNMIETQLSPIYQKRITLKINLNTFSEYKD